MQRSKDSTFVIHIKNKNLLKVLTRDLKRKAQNVAKNIIQLTNLVSLPSKDSEALVLELLVDASSNFSIYMKIISRRRLALTF